jgi:hypothetical protein
MITTSEITLSELKKLVKEENLLPFNREIAKAHVRKMMKSVNESGIIRDPLIGRMKYDGNRLAIVDGQHLVSAIVILSKDKRFKNITCKIKDYKTKNEVIKDISKVNNVQKSWKDENYLDAWYRFGPSNNALYYPNYAHLWDRFKQGSLPIGLIIEAYTSNKDAFREGSLTFFDVNFSDNAFTTLNELKKEFNCPSLMLYGALKFLLELRRVNGFVSDEMFKKLYSRLYTAMRHKTYDQDNTSSREAFYAFAKKVYFEL